MTAPERGAAKTLAELRERYGREPRLGCSLVAHRDLGYCAHCPSPDMYTPSIDREVAGWRLLAMAERGVPRQPSEVEKEKMRVRQAIDELQREHGETP